VKICLVHNSYGRRSGEEVAVDGLRDSLAHHGHTVVPFFKSNVGLYEDPLTRFAAFFSGIYSAKAQREFGALLDIHRPDIVHVNNLFPLISPSILEVTRRRGIPTVMTLHNFRLLCPTGLMFSRGDVCHRCVGGREWHCALGNCAGEWPRSIGYAMRSAAARVRGSFTDGIDRYIAPSEFVKSMLVVHGYPAERIDVIRYLVNLQAAPSGNAEGEYVAYVGRISPEKGVDTIVEAARACPDMAFRFAGHHLRMPGLPGQAPSNCEFMGEIPPEQVNSLLYGAKFTVFASRWYETTGLAMIEAMASGKAVICANIGCLPEFVEDGANGLLFEAGNSADLANKVRYLWQRPELCRRMGEAAREKVLEIFSPKANYARLLHSYHAAANRVESLDTGLAGEGACGV
jgi:glycosyltransferase involved in cell wall biosynthesis